MIAKDKNQKGDSLSLLSSFSSAFNSKIFYDGEGAPAREISLRTSSISPF